MVCAVTLTIHLAGWEDLAEVAYLLSTVLPNRVSIPFNPGASSVAISAALQDLCALMAETVPTDVTTLKPTFEQWQRNRSHKAWSNWTEVLSDHRIFASYWGNILAAYVGPNSMRLESSLCESLFLTVNSVNQCGFCSGLHCQLGRMAGLPNTLKLNQARNAEECIELSGQERNANWIRYAHIFACNNGRGEDEAQAFAVLVREHGHAKALSGRALCWFLYWGSFCGNTLNGSLSYRTPKPGSSESFLLQFLAFYGVMYFGVINLVSIVTMALPETPRWFNALFGAILCSVAGSAFVPLGLIGFLFGINSNPTLLEEPLPTCPNGFIVSLKALFCVAAVIGALFSLGDITFWFFWLF